MECEPSRKVDRKMILREARDVVLLALAGIVMTWSGLACRNCIDNPREFWIVASFASLIWIALWKGNAHLGEYVTRDISWIKDPGRKFAAMFAFTLIYTFGAMYLLGAVYRLAFDVNLTSGAMFSVIITIIISLFMHGRAFLIGWRKTALDAERMQRESIAARYETLKSQVNPHFLFNSFNALTNLVYEDPDKAAKFIRQLSLVYRYVLDTRDKEVVKLSEEVEFLRSYIYLQEIRFGYKLTISLKIANMERYVAPLALQMLIENAIKHNVVSEDDPLKIEVFDDDQYLTVKNNLQRKTQIGEASAGVGLENIIHRYEFLSDRKVVVNEDQSHFMVRLPALTFEKTA